MFKILGSITLVTVAVVMYFRWLKKAVHTTVAEAMAAMQEACAIVADRYEENAWEKTTSLYDNTVRAETAESIAFAIRALDNPLDPKRGKDYELDTRSPRNL